MSKKTFRNAAISTMAASATVAAVAPAAVSADTESDVSFSDVTPEHTHYDNIIKMAEQGDITGHKDGTFKPYNNIERGQMAAIITNALDLDIPENVDKVLEKYDDVDAGADYAEEIAAVTAADIFTGSEGHFGEYENISREQIASVLVEAYDLNKYDNAEDVDLNTDHISESHVDNVQTLANLGITVATDNYQAYENERRDQFATMLAKTQEVVEENAPGVENVETTVNGDDTFTINGTATGIADAAHLIVTNGDGEKVVDNEEISVDEDGSFSFTTDQQLDVGEYSYTIMGMENGNHGTANAQQGNFTVEAPAVEDVSANNTKEVEVNFNKALDADELTRDDISVTDADSDAKQIVKSVELADDGESAKVEFYNALPADATYNVNVDVDGETLEGKLVIGDLEPATIEADAEQTVQAGQNEKVEYTVYDEDGIELTSDDYDADNINFTSAVVNDNGEVELENGTSTTTKVQYKDGSDVVAESDEIKLTAEASEVDNISNWTVVNDQNVDDNDDFIGFDDEDYDRVTEAFEGDQLEVALEDQFERDVTDDYTVEYESLDTSVAIVDKHDGQFNKVYEGGNVPVEISVKNSDGEVVKTKTVEVEAKEAPEFASFDFGDQDSINISTGNKQTITVEANLLDQYGNDIDGVDNIEVESKDDDVTVDNDGVDGSTFSFDVNADEAPEGSYDVKVSAADDDGETIAEETIEVKVSESGLFDHYDVSGLEDSLDLNASDDTDTTDEMNISVQPVDEDGNATSEKLDGLGIKVENENGDSAAGFDATGNGSLTMNDAAEEGNYTVIVSNDGSVLKKHDFKVVDTSEEAKDPEVTFTSSSLEDSLPAQEDASEELNAALTNIADIENADGDIEDVDFTSSAQNIIEQTNNGVETSEGEATITVETVTIDDEEIDMDNAPINVTVKSDENSNN